MKQFEFDLRPDWMSCRHEFCFDSRAYVPAGVVCSECGALILQWIPQPPSELGYLSADWNWKLQGNAWTTKELHG